MAKAVVCVPKLDHFREPDGIWYRRAVLPRDGATLVDFKSLIDSAVLSHSGIAIFDQVDDPLYVLSPGDAVSMKLYNTLTVRWPGDCGLKRDSKLFTSPTRVKVGSPNLEFLPEMARQSARYILKEGFRRPTARVLCFREEGVQASDLVFDLFVDEFDNQENATARCELFLRFLPRHLVKRTAFVKSTTFPASFFTEL